MFDFFCSSLLSSENARPVQATAFDCGPIADGHPDANSIMSRRLKISPPPGLFGYLL